MGVRFSHVAEVRVGLSWPSRGSFTVSLPITHRIRRPAEFRSVLALGNRVSDKHMNVVASANNLHCSRIGLSVSKRVGTAVMRNLIKRRIQSVFANIFSVGGWDLVVIAKPTSSDVSYAELYAGMYSSVKRLGIEVTPQDQEVIV